MFRLYSLNQTAMEDGDFTLLADVHASSSGLKSLCTIMASNAIEECRRACGGHGFSLAGGLASFYADYLPQVTWLVSPPPPWGPTRTMTDFFTPRSFRPSGRETRTCLPNSAVDTFSKLSELFLTIATLL